MIDYADDDDVLLTYRWFFYWASLVATFINLVMFLDALSSRHPLLLFILGLS